MAKTVLSPLGANGYITHGYGQVEPNHLSAQRTGQIYAQLPAKFDINILENGQFVKYDYVKGVVDFGERVDGDSSTSGEWMLVNNEVKLYRDHLNYDDFAMKKEDYAARVYSPIGAITGYENSRNYNGTVLEDQYEPDTNGNPFVVEKRDEFTKMPDNGVTGEGFKASTMVPRVFKTNVGDIFTTNTIKETTLALGDLLYVGDNGYLTKTKKTTTNANGAISGDMTWQVVKVYTLADREKAVKIMRIA